MIAYGNSDKEKKKKKRNRITEEINQPFITIDHYETLKISRCFILS